MARAALAPARRAGRGAVPNALASRAADAWQPTRARPTLETVTLPRLLRTLSIALGVGVAFPGAAEAQFNPHGRAKPKAPAASRPARPAERSARAESKKKPTAEALIARYRGIVLSRPGAQFPLQRLTDLYRERDGNLAALVAEFEGLAAGGEWNALVALAGVYRHDGRHAAAIEKYEEAIRARADDPAAIMALAHLLEDRGDPRGARSRLEQALPLLREGAEQEQTLRTLMTLSLELEDWAAAREHHGKLVKRAQGSFFVRAELGRELLSRGKYALAEEEFRKVVESAAGDNRALAPALRDLGRAQAKLDERTEALATLQRALRAAGTESGLRREIFEIVVEVHRAAEALPELVADLEKQHVADFDRLRILGGLYEEVGRVDDAVATYRKALSRNTRDVAMRLRVIQLLQLQGELDAAIGEYETLIRAAPRNPDYVLQLAEALIQRGDRALAVQHLGRLEARSRGDEETLAALVDFYERIDEKERAIEVLRKLAQSGSHDPRHLVELGERHFQQGDKAKAVQTWERIRVVVPNKARALLTLGDVYLEHDMPAEALEAFREAEKTAPNQKRYRKALALALERVGASASTAGARRQHYDDARKLWESILADAEDDSVAREARTHVVTLWSLSGQLAGRVVPLERRFGGKPPDLDAGRLLAEVFLKLRRPADAERVLAEVVAAAPGDAGSLIRLELAMIQQRKTRAAIAVLEKLVQAEPKRAREYYQRMAQYAAELYEDELAIRYASKAVELSPDDASGHKKLGEMYRRRQDTERAIRQFRLAIVKNDRLFPVYFDLAELLMGTGQYDEADRLLRRVIRSSPDDELVLQAARLSMQLNLGNDTLESLERELLPVALGNPQKPLYRQLLVEIYGALAFPLVHAARGDDEAEAKNARSALRRVGERAVKPLLDALGDERESQQRVAVELLGHIHNPSAGPALFAYATGPADSELRSRAMIAVGLLEDPDMVLRISSLVAPDGVAAADDSDPVVMAAAWGIARLRSAGARKLQRLLLESDAPGLRALGALGLATSPDRADQQRLLESARALDAGPLARAAAVHALGDGTARAEEPLLVQLAESGDRVLRSAALLALARSKSVAARRVLADALLSPEANLREAAASAAVAHAIGDYRAPTDGLGLATSRVDVRGLLDRRAPGPYSPAEHAAAVDVFAPELSRAVAAAALGSVERARVVADLLAPSGDRPMFAPFSPAFDEAVPEKLRAGAERGADAISRAAVPAFVALAQHPSAEVRALAIRFLSRRSDVESRRVVLAGLTDDDDSVRRAALAAVGRSGVDEAVGAVIEILEAPEWSARARAAEALGGLARARDATAAAALRKVAEGDRFSLVREAALRALVRVDPAGHRALVARVAKSDVEPRVRATAARLLLETK